MSRPCKIKGLNLQTSLSALADTKGLSGALTNLKENPSPSAREVGAKGIPTEGFEEVPDGEIVNAFSAALRASAR
jgi:hypothetical protein